MSDLSRGDLTAVTVTGNQELAPNVRVISFPRHQPFRAGQTVSLALEPGGPQRIYSIASGEHEKEIRILYDVRHGGKVTPHMSRLSSGDTLFVSSPSGTFLGTPEPAWWIAAGTGVAPFASMFLSGMHQGKVLIHGGKHRQSFYFSGHFLSLMEGRYIRCCSRETGEGLWPGRVTAYLARPELILPEVKYYLCGSTEMVVETRDLLIRRGVPFARILAEIYF
ncbi:MAG: hypothetical protein JW861_06565 [Bacteroidales bacterium]|nr:hypothetical protein [Bacteroidales bacterium]